MLDVLLTAASAVRSALDELDDWRQPGSRPGQYLLDVVADAAAVEVLHGSGLAVLSEESGVTEPRDGIGPGCADLLVVLDPVDGSTNASIGLPWYATSCCVLDATGPSMAVVVNQATGVRYEAIRGEGAARDGMPISCSSCRDPGRAVVGLTGTPVSPPAWWQFRALGAAALDLCAVAEGVLDAFLVGAGSSLFGWDYLGGLLVGLEAGAVAAEANGRELIVRDATPRAPIVAASGELLDALVPRRGGGG